MERALQKLRANFSTLSGPQRSKRLTKSGYPKMTARMRSLSSKYIAEEMKTGKYPPAQAEAIGISRARRKLREEASARRRSSRARKPKAQRPKAKKKARRPKGGKSRRGRRR